MTLSRPRLLNLPAREPWERNLYVLWLALALTMIGFGAIFPFVPLYMRELGIEDPGQAALWGGIAGGVGAFFMVFSGPVWGVMGDRSGRKKNVVRGIFGFGAVMFAASFVPNVYYLLGVWLFLGFMPGPGIVSMPLIAAMAPKHRVPYAIGVLMSASFLGFTVGPLVGGLLIDSLGFRTTLMMTAGLLAVSGSMVLFFVKEGRETPATPQRLDLRQMLSGIAKVARSREIAPILGVLFMVQFGGSLMLPALPLFLGTLSSGEDVGASVGVAFAILGVTGGVSSILIGRMGRRIGRTPLIAGSFLLMGLAHIPMLMVGDILSAYLVLGVLGFLGGGLVTTAFALVGTSAGENQGAAYGAAQSASSIAWFASPLVGGAIAGMWGLREVFLVEVVAYVVAGALAIRLLAGTEAEKELVTIEVAPILESAGGD
ncbi:MAG: MFS transporter [Chloroflexi bacterium]|nr:MFS transporter [Chloroflexota bacterium]